MISDQEGENERVRGWKEFERNGEEKLIETRRDVSFEPLFVKSWYHQAKFNYKSKSKEQRIMCVIFAFVIHSSIRI
jgi:hypothetical protein